MAEKNVHMEQAEGRADASSADRGHEPSGSGPSSSAALATAVTSTSPGTLFSAALHLVQTFLSRDEWLETQPWRINRHWGQVSATMPSLHFCFSLAHNRVTAQTGDSATARHITSLAVDVRASSVAQTTVEAIGCLTPLRKLCLNIGEHDAVNLKPLLALQQLREFTLYTSKGWSTPWHLSVMKQMSYLERLERYNEHGGILWFDRSNEMPWLVKDHQLRRLQFITCEARDALCLDVLQRFPSLTQLANSGWGDVKIGLLGVVAARFPHLATLSLELEWWSDLLPHMSLVARLRELHIALNEKEPDLEEDLAVVFASMTSVHTLMVRCNHSSQGSFLSHLHRAPVLTSLKISRLRVRKDALVAALQPCTRLERLVLITHSSREADPVPRWSPEDEAALQPPSKLLPGLKFCDFTDW